MTTGIKRREFVQLSMSSMAMAGMFLGGTSQAFTQDKSKIISPGCRKSKVKIAKLYIGVPNPHWPTPTLELDNEIKRYEEHFSKFKERDFNDVEFTLTQKISSLDDLNKALNASEDVDGFLAIQLSIHVWPIISTLVDQQKPVMLFAIPYSGHEWTRYGQLRSEERGKQFDCILSSDLSQLGEAVRPIRAIHHLREAKILNITARDRKAFMKEFTDKFGVSYLETDNTAVYQVYETIPDADAKAETKRWMEEAETIVEPDEDEIFKSCKLALALEKMMDQEEATVITADCYGTMWRKLPAYPCVGFTRANDMGLGGICESDLQSAMTHILFQSLTGKPGFISDPTIDMSNKTIILPHCLGNTRMLGPDGPRSPYRLRTIMERREGCVPQVFMPTGLKATHGKLVDANLFVYFTGDIVDAPDTERGCRSKITTTVDGDIDKVWKNWAYGLHRVTVYGDITTDLERVCKFKNIQMTCEA